MRIFIILLFLLLASCGFKPRGDVPLSPALHNLYVHAADPYGELARNLKQYLKYSGVHLANSAQNATAVLDILKEDTAQQLLSVSGTQQTRQYNLILMVTFQVTSPSGKILIPPQTLTETRTIPIQSNQILGGSNEANNLFRQMRLAMVYDIMTRLSSQYASNVLQIKP